MLHVVGSAVKWCVSFLVAQRGCINCCFQVELLNSVPVSFGHFDILSDNEVGVFCFHTCAVTEAV